MPSRQWYKLIAPQRSTDSGFTPLRHSYKSSKRLNSLNSDSGSSTSEDEESLSSRPARQSRFEKFLASYEFSISLWTTLCCVVLTVNVVLTIAVAIKTGFHDGIGELNNGNCQQIQRSNTAIHILINILSTALLAGSNFCMQCLCAPTRSEIDKAHSRGVALDVGIPSLKNLVHVKKRKPCLWLLFGLSSLPLHFLYNSVVYASTTYNEYVALSGPALLEPGSLNATELYDKSSALYNTWLNDLHNKSLGDSGEFVQLSPAQCIQEYARDYVSSKGNVILVPQAGENNTYEYIDARYFRRCGRTIVMEWVCQQDPDCKSPCRTKIPQLVQDADNWSPAGFKVDHCIAQTVPETCKLLFSLPIAITVIVFNIAKAVLMMVAAWRVDMKPLLTIGDALHSFLSNPDTTTYASCLYDAKDWKDVAKLGHPQAKRWDNRPRRFGSNPGKWRWVQAIIPWTIAIFLVVGFMSPGIESIKSQYGETALDALQLGLGGVRSETVIPTSLPNTGSRGFVSNAMLANLPQVILSFVYFSYNALFTHMLSGLEWSRLRLRRKGLRVSKEPMGNQRSTYFLQLPYRYSIPLMALSAVLHWLVSQGLFLVALDPVDLQPGSITVKKPSRSNMSYSIGWSPLAALLAIMAGLIMLVSAIAVGIRRYPTNMPLGANNSLVLAASCHPDKSVEGDNISFRKLKWGVVSALGPGKEIEHCALSSKEPKNPEAGKFYA